MASRIEWVEVLSFRLKVPSLVLEGLPEEVEGDLALRLTPSEDGSLLLGQVDADSFLRFRIHAESAELVEVAVTQDEEGLFFQAVLGALMVRHGGDLRARLIYDRTAGEPGEPWAEVRIEAGRTTYPGLATQAAAANLAHAASEGGAVEAAEEDPEGPLTPEEEELDRLLRKANAAWQEYQRLKRERQSS